MGAAGRLSLPLRIKGHGLVRAQHDPHVRDTQMNMCQRRGNESRAKGAWERANLIRAVIKPCQEKEASADIYPSLTDTDGLLTHKLYTANHAASSNHMHVRAIRYEVK